LGQLTAEREISVGVVGCGHWGPNHVRVFSSLPGSKVAAVADPDVRRLESSRQSHPAACRFTDYRELLAQESLDAIVVATPTRTHYEIARAALEAGKHVLVEKPLCLTAQEGEALVRLARETGVVLMVGQVFLFHNGIVKLKEFLESGEVGKLYYIGSTRTNLGPIRQDVNAVYDLESLVPEATGELRVTPQTLIDLFNSGTAYVQVTTVLNPTGELRGTIVPTDIDIVP